MTFNLSSDEDSGTNHFFINQLKWIGIFILVWIGISFVIPFPFSLPVIIGIFLLIGYYIRKRALKRQKNMRIHKETAQDSIDPNSEKFQTAPSKNANRVFCIYCGKERDSSGEFCPRCGRQNSVNMKICRKCNSYMSNDSEFCANCGQKFEEKTNVPGLGKRFY